MSSWACASCAGENPEGMRFCGHCGTPSAAAAPAPPPPPPPAPPRVEAEGQSTDERRLVSAVFADISGFTTLAHRLDAEQLVDVIDPLLTAMTKVVERYGGRVDKYAGDAVLARFGTPICHEDDVDRALLSAIGMHGVVAEMAATVPGAEELTLHVGVNTGSVVARLIGSDQDDSEYGILGDAINLAQRLESLAPSGDTYVGELSASLASERFVLEPLGEKTVKGVDHPIPVFRLVGEQEPQTRALAADACIGRDDEIDGGRRFVAGVGAGRGGLLTVSGEAGMGKSRLTVEVREAAEAAGVRWVEARCLSYGRELGFRPLVDLLRAEADIGPDVPAEAAAALVANRLAAAGDRYPHPALATLLGLTEGGSSLEAADFATALRVSLAAWMRAVATVPTVFALEDAHWLDDATLDVLTQLVPLCADLPVGLYVTGRPEAAAAMATLADAVPDDRRHAVSLARLTDPQVTAVVASTLGATAPPAVVDLVCERSEGNPFFARELVRALEAAGVLARSEGGAVLTAPLDESLLPPTIEGVLSSRMDRLPRSATEVLQMAAVIGRQAPVPLVEAVAPAGTEVQAHLRTLVDAELVTVEGAELWFRHALVRDVAYGRLLRRNRRALHLRVADAAEVLLGSTDDSIDLLARHLYLGGGGAKALDHLLRAGRRSKALFANQQSRLRFEQAREVAVELGGDRTTVAEVDGELADLAELQGDYEVALDIHRRLLDGPAPHAAQRGVAACLRLLGRCEEALLAIDGFPEDAELRLERGRALLVLGRLVDAADAMQEAVAASEPGTACRSRSLVQLARTELTLGHLDVGLERCREALAELERGDDLRGRAMALRVLSGAHFDRGEFDEAARRAREGLALAERIGIVEESAACLVNLGIAEQERGDLDAAEAASRRAITAFELIGHRSGRCNAIANLADVLADAGRFEEALEQAELAMALAELLDDALVVADVLHYRASIHLRQGDAATALAEAEEAAARLTAAGAEHYAEDSRALADEARAALVSSSAPAGLGTTSAASG